MIKRGITLFLSILFLSCSVNADKPKHLGTFGAWSAYQVMEQGQKACYMLSFPEKEEGNYTKRGRVYLLVTHRPAFNTLNIVSFHAGYGFKNGQEVTATVAGSRKKESFTLFTEGETAWAKDGETDKQITTALSKWGHMITVDGASARGTRTKDTYSLKGSLQALEAISRACGVR